MQAPLLGTVGENRNSIFIYCQTFGELPPMILMLSECTSSTSLSTLSRFWLLLQPCISPAQAEAPTTPSKSYFALTEKILFLLWVHVLDGSFQLSRTWSPEVFKKQTNKPNDRSHSFMESKSCEIAFNLPHGIQVETQFFILEIKLNLTPHHLACWYYWRSFASHGLIQASFVLWHTRQMGQGA